MRADPKNNKKLTEKEMRLAAEEVFSRSANTLTTAAPFRILANFLKEKGVEEINIESLTVIIEEMSETTRESIISKG